MKKTLLVIMVISLAGCAYNPIIDTGGRSELLIKAKQKKLQMTLFCAKKSQRNTLTNF